VSSTPSPSRRPRGRPPIPAEVQRERLLAGLLRAVEAYGYEKTRVSDIVRHAGMSSRSFYQLFDSKDDLLVAYVEQTAQSLVADLAAVLAEERDPLTCVERALGLYLDIFSSVIQMDLEGLGGAAGRRVRQVRSDSVREISRAIYEQLGNAHEDGRIAREPDRVTVELVVTGIEGISFRYLARGRTRELKRLRPTFVSALVRALL
jgi:AcrR family transcriptional regulator